MKLSKTLVVLLVIWALSMFYLLVDTVLDNSRERNRCEDSGGVYVDSVCVKRSSTIDVSH